MTDENLLKECGFSELETQYRLISESNQAPLAKLGLYATASMKHLVTFKKPLQHLDDNGLFGIGLYTGEDGWHSRVVDIVATTLEKAIHAGAIRTVEPRRVGIMFVDAILSMMAHRLETAEPDEIEDDVRLLMDLYLNGLTIRY